MIEAGPVLVMGLAFSLLIAAYLLGKGSRDWPER